MDVEYASTAEVARVVRQCLAEGKSVQIDGLGTFEPSPGGVVRFLPRTAPAVFIAYVQEDAEAAARLYDELEGAGFAPWMDRRKLLPGQNWPRSIEAAIARSDYAVACFSRRSAAKRGGFQAEIRYALDCARRVPLDDIFLIPVRLEDCRVPHSIRSEIQYLDLFPDWDKGVRQLIRVLRRRARPGMLR
ncbi:MAG: TIR domain-containing protein [Bryobacteraceae bacterium]